MSVNARPPRPRSKEGLSPLQAFLRWDFSLPSVLRILGPSSSPLPSQISQQQTSLMGKTRPPPELLSPALLLAHRAAALAVLGEKQAEDKDQTLKQKAGLAVS